MKLQRRSFNFATIFALLCILCVDCVAIAQSSLLFHGIGYVAAIDPLHNRVSFSYSGSVYQVDSGGAKITLLTPVTKPPGTGDLVAGMRVEVDGPVDAEQVVHATVIQVLPYLPPGRGDFPQRGRAFKGAGVLWRHAEEPSIYGAISREATFFARKIRVQTSVGEVNVAVPKGIPIRLGTVPVSVHDLRLGTDVHIFGQFTNGDSLTADRIDVGEYR
jgi:hypothetical protein